MKTFEQFPEQITDDFANKMDDILQRHDNDPKKLIGILLDIQDAVDLHYITQPIAYRLAKRLNIKITQIYDVLTFYAGLYTQPRAHFCIQICDSAPCRVNDSEGLHVALKDILGIDIGEVTYDNRFTLEKVPCFGACDVSPAFRAGGKVYGRLSTRESVIDALKELMREGESNG